MRNLSFYSAFTFILISAILVALTAISTLSHHPTLINIFIMQCFCISFSFAMVGIGLGLPLLIVGGILGWGQFILLLTGNVRPHLGREGFFNALKILFSKM